MLQLAACFNRVLHYVFLHLHVDLFAHELLLVVGWRSLLRHGTHVPFEETHRLKILRCIRRAYVSDFRRWCESRNITARARQVAGRGHLAPDICRSLVAQVSEDQRLQGRLEMEFDT